MELEKADSAVVVTVLVAEIMVQVAVVVNGEGNVQVVIVVTVFVVVEAVVMGMKGLVVATEIKLIATRNRTQCWLHTAALMLLPKLLVNFGTSSTASLLMLFKLLLSQQKRSLHWPKYSNLSRPMQPTP